MNTLETIIISAFLWAILMILILRIGFRAINRSSYLIGWVCLLLAGALIAISGPIATEAVTHALACKVTIFEECTLW